MSEEEPRYRSAKYIVFSDFDGTITNKDSNDWMTDNLGYGAQKRRQGNVNILSGKVGFRDAFKEMLESVNEKYKFEDAKALVKQNITLDSGFKPFLQWSKSVGIPIVIVSSGMVPIIKAIFGNLVGEDEAASIEVIANDADILPDGHFQIRFRHPESHFGHDKSKALQPYKSLPQGHRPIIFFAGDGVSDMSAASSADVLFVKLNPEGSNDLAEHCAKNNIPYVPFLDFTQVQAVIEQVVKGTTTVEQINSGFRMEEVEKALAQKGQRLPQPSHF